MLKIIFTLDYEIHGNGDGNPHDLMVEPTGRMMKLFDQYGAKLTIMADMAEIIKFSEFENKNQQDMYCYKEIESQLKLAISTGHDVQMHIHSGYMSAIIDNQKLHVNWDEYNLALLDPKRISEIIHMCKAYLMKILLPIKPDYQCSAFRAANWSMVPTKGIYDGLVSNGLTIDTSVFKYGRRSNKVRFDYSDAFDALLPWKIDPLDICRKDDRSDLWEVPIYCEYRSFIHFISVIRIFRFFRAKFHKHEQVDLYEKYGHSPDPSPTKKNKSKMRILRKLTSLINKKMAWKMDFNQATGKQLIRALKRIEIKYKSYDGDLPVVLIGHSKSFIKYNEKSLEPFLKYVADNPNKYEFALFKDLNLTSISKKGSI